MRTDSEHPRGREASYTGGVQRGALSTAPKVASSRGLTGLAHAAILVACTPEATTRIGSGHGADPGVDRAVMQDASAAAASEDGSDPFAPRDPAPELPAPSSDAATVEPQAIRADCTGFDFDGDGIPLACDPFVRLPDDLQERMGVFDAENSWDQDVRVVGAGEGVAIVPTCELNLGVAGGIQTYTPPPCSVRQGVAFFGTDRVALYPELLSNGGSPLRIQYAEDGTLFLGGAGDALHVSRGEPFELAYDFDAQFELIPAVLGGVYLTYEYEERYFLDEWRSGHMRGLLESAAPISRGSYTLDQPEQLTVLNAREAVGFSHREGSELLLFRTEGSLRPLFQGVRGNYWYCVEHEDSVRVVQLDDRGAVLTDTPLPEGAGCGQSARSSVFGALWLDRAQDADGAALFRVDGRSGELTRFDPVGDVHYVYEQAGVAFLRTADQQIHSAYDGNVRSLGAPLDPSVSPSFYDGRLYEVSQTAEGVLTVRVFEPDRVFDVSPELGPEWDELSYRLSQDVLWFERDVDEQHTEFYRLDGDELVLALETESASLWPTGENLVVIPQTSGDLFLLAGRTIEPLRQNVRNAGYLGVTGQRSPTGEWLFQYETDTGRAIARIVDDAWVALERGIESEVAYLSLDAGPYFVAFQRGGSWHVLRYDSEEFTLVHTGYDAVTLSGEFALLTRATEAGLWFTVCPLRGRDGPCVTAPEPNLRLQYVSVRGRLNAVVENEAGDLYLWRGL